MLDVLLLILGILLIILGIVGEFVPVVPGAAVVYGGMLLLGWQQGFSEWSLAVWIALAILTVFLSVADIVSSFIGTKIAKASRTAMILAGLGAFIGLIIGNLPGLLLGPFVGALVGELIHGSTGTQTLKSAFGATIGLLSSVFVKIMLIALMLVVFLVGWIW